MIHSTFGLIHTLAAITALLAGLLVFLRPKAGTLHRRIGYVYSAAMVIMIATALWIYQLTGSFNLLHAFALVSTVQLSCGLYHVIARRPRGAWMKAHFEWMCGSYIGLCAALVAETSTRVLMPWLHDRGVRSFGWFWAIVGAVTFAVVWAGQVLMNRNRGILQRLGQK